MTIQFLEDQGFTKYDLGGTVQMENDKILVIFREGAETAYYGLDPRLESYSLRIENPMEIFKEYLEK